ncbi:MAG: type II secretion system protein M [Rhodospirillaceae bacterium]|nr:type II secretion system protein M [Rhodospirillaceae bacterium]
MNALKSWWASRAPREQLGLVLSAALLLGVLAFQGIYKPISAYSRSAASAYAEATAYLSDVEQLVRTIRGLGESARGRAPLPADGLRVAAAAAAKEADLVINRLQPRDDGVVEFWIEDADSARIFRWLAGLNRRYGIVATKIDMRRTEQSARVRAQIALSAGSAP